MNINRNRLAESFAALVAVDSPSYGEREMADELKRRLAALGIPVIEDGAGAEIGGNAGNLIAKVPGTLPGAPLIFSAHMDTVEPSRGKRAVFREDGRITSGGDTVLGADDLAGVAAILEAVTVLKERKLPHRSLELVFPAAEEPYTQGTRHMDLSLLEGKEAYVLDTSGEAGLAVLQAPTIIYLRAEVRGRAAHAGSAPEKGIHAIKIAAAAINAIPCGRVEGEVTVNVGTIHGGAGTNVVPESCAVEIEVRSFDHPSALRWQEKIVRIFSSAAAERGGSAEIFSEVRTVAYHTEEDAPVVRRFRRACEQTGIEFRTGSTFGGSDNNTFCSHGISGVVMANGMFNIHTCQEYTTLEQLEKTAELTLALMREAEV